MIKKTVLLSGVHGVGKGYFLKKKFENDNRFEILGASSLISKYKKADDAGYKKVQNVSNNQQILLAALSIEKNKITKDIILDGHICMINAEGNVESIPERFFLDAEISGIVLLQDDVDNIIQRQAERDGVVLAKNIVKEMQEKEAKYCEQLFLKYNISYKTIDNSCEYIQFCEIVDRM